MPRQPPEYNLKIRLIDRLGGKCVKCWNRNLFHLQIEHKFNNGALRRKQYPKTKVLFRAYLKGKLPISELQCMCANCNQEKHIRENKRLTEFLTKSQ